MLQILDNSWSYLQIYNYAKAPDFLNIHGRAFFMKRWETNCNWTSPVGETRIQLRPTCLPDLTTLLKGLLWLLIPAPTRV